MSLLSKIAALKRLSERPGTEDEGLVAKEMLSRLEAKRDQLPEGEKWDLSDHEGIRREIRIRFPVGTLVYYNNWAYQLNQRGFIIGLPHLDCHWNWHSVKFDHLKRSRSVPVVTDRGWHLSTKPITQDEAEKLGWRDFGGGKQQVALSIDALPFDSDEVAG